MIVRCPSCKTTYKVADDLVKNRMPAFRCSRCKHTFELGSVEAPGKPVVRANSSERLFSKTMEEPEMSFTFARKKEADGENRNQFAKSPLHDYEFPARSAEDGEVWSMSIAESTPDKSFTPSQPHDGDDADKLIDSPEAIPPQLSPSQPLPLAREATDNVLSLDPYRDQAASTAPFMTLFGFLVILFAFATAFHSAHPDVSEGIVKTIPLLGSAVFRNNHLKNGVALQSLRASHQIIQGNREVLVISGIAQNQNPVVIREVRVAGQLYNLEGKEIEQQTIWIGNAISPRILRGMTTQDVSDLQRLKPLKTFGIPPGDSIPFTIVFLKSTKEIRDFSCEVVGAEGEA
jgi:predicted Zn finger-like uncharacterized protein